MEITLNKIFNAVFKKSSQTLESVQQQETLTSQALLDSSCDESI